MFRRHPYLSLTTFAYLGFVAWITLGPQPFDDNDNALMVFGGGSKVGGSK